MIEKIYIFILSPEYYFQTIKTPFYKQKKFARYS